MVTTGEQQRKPQQTGFLHQLHKLLWWVVLWWGWSAPQCSSPLCWTPSAAPPAWAATPREEGCPRPLTPQRPRGWGPAAHKVYVSAHILNYTWLKHQNMRLKILISFPHVKLDNPITDGFIQYLLTTHTYKGGIQAHNGNEKSQSTRIYLVN